MKTFAFILGALLYATSAFAGQYTVRFVQPEEEPGDCLDITGWELWGHRGTAAPGLVASIPQAASLCAGGEVSATVSANLRHGEWRFTLVAVSEGGRSESDVLVQRIPPPRPVLNAITR